MKIEGVENGCIHHNSDKRQCEIASLINQKVEEEKRYPLFACVGFKDGSSSKNPIFPCSADSRVSSQCNFFAPKKIPTELRENTFTAIRFLEADKSWGMDILLDYGSVQVFPGGVYICATDQVDRAIPGLNRTGIKFDVRRNISPSLNADGVRALVERGNWEEIRDRQ